MTDWLTGDWLITDWLTDNWLNDWLTDWLTDWLADWLTVWLTVWLLACLMGWLTDRLIDWLIDWQLTEWLSNWLRSWLRAVTEWQYERLLTDKLITFQKQNNILFKRSSMQLLQCNSYPLPIISSAPSYSKHWYLNNLYIIGVLVVFYPRYILQAHSSFETTWVW